MSEEPLTSRAGPAGRTRTYKGTTRKYGSFLRVKTTVELPEDLLQRAKAAAASRGESFKQLLTTALHEHLARVGGMVQGKEPWRRVFGRAARSEVEAVDRAVAEDLEQIDLESWR